MQAYGDSHDDRIHLTMADGVADVRLNREDKMNALDPAMFKAIMRYPKRPHGIV